MGLEVDSEETSCDDLREPTPRKEKWHKCPYEGCNASFRRPWRLDSHVCCHTGERPFKCGVEGCTRAYTNYSHLRRHITLTHEKKLYKTTHRCPYEGCMREFHALGSMRNHYNQAHERQLPYVCSHCKKGFRKHNQLKTHSFEHTGIPEFPCDMCEAKFVTMHHLKRHKRVHSKTYVCNVPECSKELKTWTLLRKHYMLDHPIKLKCATCDKEFRSKGSLNHHVMIHMDESKRTVYPCPYESCPRFYLAERNLNHHIRSSHEGKKHKCPHESCNRELSSKHRLQLHLNLHTSGRLKTVSLKQKTRKKRKDKGIGKRSLAVKLSGIQVPYEVEKLILSRDRASPQDKFIKDCSVALNRLDQQFIKTDLCAKVESSHESASETEMCVCPSETEQSELELEPKSSAADPLEHNENYKCAQQATLLSKVETVLEEQNADTESLTGAENVCSVQLNKDDGSVNSKLHLPHTQGTEVTETANSGQLTQQTGPTLRKHYLKIHGESICLEMRSSEGETVNSSEDDDLENALQAEMQVKHHNKIIHKMIQDSVYYRKNEENDREDKEPNESTEIQTSPHVEQQDEQENNDLQHRSFSDEQHSKNVSSILQDTPRVELQEEQSSHVLQSSFQAKTQKKKKVRRVLQHFPHLRIRNRNVSRALQDSVSVQLQEEQDSHILQQSSRVKTHKKNVRRVLQGSPCIKICKRNVSSMLQESPQAEKSSSQVKRQKKTVRRNSPRVKIRKRNVSENIVLNETKVLQQQDNQDLHQSFSSVDLHEGNESRELQDSPSVRKHNESECIEQDSSSTVPHQKKSVSEMLQDTSLVEVRDQWDLQDSSKIKLYKKTLTKMLKGSPCAIKCKVNDSESEVLDVHCENDQDLHQSSSSLELNEDYVDRVVQDSPCVQHWDEQDSHILQGSSQTVSRMLENSPYVKMENDREDMVANEIRALQSSPQAQWGSHVLRGSSQVKRQKKNVNRVLQDSPHVVRDSHALQHHSFSDEQCSKNVNIILQDPPCIELQDEWDSRDLQHCSFSDERHGKNVSRTLQDPPCVEIRDEWDSHDLQQLSSSVEICKRNVDRVVQDSRHSEQYSHVVRGSSQLQRHKKNVNRVIQDSSHDELQAEWDSHTLQQHISSFELHKDSVCKLLPEFTPIDVQRRQDGKVLQNSSYVNDKSCVDTSENNVYEKSDSGLETKTIGSIKYPISKTYKKPQCRNKQHSKTGGDVGVLACGNSY